MSTSPSGEPPSSGTPLRGPIPFRGASFLRRHKGPSLIAGLLLLGLLLWGLISLYNHFTGQKKDDPKGKAGLVTAVNVVEVKREHFQDVMQEMGNIFGGSEIPLRFEAEGIIEQFEFREGDKIRKGDIIARLNNRDASLKVRKAKLELHRIESLYAIGAVTREKLDEARVSYELAVSDLNKTYLRAARDGILGNKDAEVGEYVTPSKRVAMLVSIDDVIARIGIIEKELDRINIDQKVVLTVDTYPGAEFTGHIVRISPIIDEKGRTLTAEVEIPNEGGLLLPGMFARSKILVHESDDAIAVPNDAVEKTASGSRVYVVTKDNKAEARDVEVVYVSAQFSEISKGIEPGELVITQRPQDLKPGAAVKVIEVAK